MCLVRDIYPVTACYRCNGYNRRITVRTICAVCAVLSIFTVHNIECLSAWMVCVRDRDRMTARDGSDRDLWRYTVSTILTIRTVLSGRTLLTL